MIKFNKPKIVEKVWGREVIIESNDQYCGKFLEFNKGASSSLHFHMEKTETWFVDSGQILLTSFMLAEGVKLTQEFNPGDIIHIPAGQPHKVQALLNTRLIEFSSKDKATDSYRLDSSKAANA